MTRAVEDQSAPIPEEITSKLGRAIEREKWSFGARSEEDGLAEMVPGICIWHGYQGGEPPSWGIIPLNHA